MTRKNNSPVMFDANILLGFKGQMKYLFSFFEKIINVFIQEETLNH